MPRSASRLAQYGSVATLLGAAAMQSARAEEPEINTADTTDHILTLVDKTLSSEQTERIQAIAALLGEPDISQPNLPHGSLETMLQDECTVQRLIGQVREGTRSEALAAAEVLRDEWLQHDNYHLRTTVAEALMSSETAMSVLPTENNASLRNMPELPMEQGVEEWWQRVKDESWLLQQPNALAQEWNAPFFQKRQAAWRQIELELRSVQQYAYPLPVGAMNTLRSLRGHTSDEVAERADVLLQRLDEQLTFRSALPPLRMSADAVLNQMNDHLGVQISVDESLRDAAAGAMVETQPGRNSYAHQLAAVCNALGAVPQYRNNPHVLELVPQENKNTRLVPYDTALAVCNDPEMVDGGGLQTNMQLFTDPNFAILDMEAVAKRHVDAPSLKVETGDSARHNWDFRHGGGRQPTSSLRYDGPNQVEPWEKASGNKPDLFLVAWMAAKPQQETISLSEGFANYHDGVHHIRLDSQEQPDGTWSVDVKMGVYQHLQWSDTTHDTDMLTYAAADATQFSFRSADGAPMPADRGDAVIDHRQMYFQFTLPEEPTEVDVRTFLRIVKEHIHFSSDGDVDTQRMRDCITLCRHV